MINEIYFRFTLKEVEALYRLIEHQWITREDEEIWDVTHKIAKIVAENELATGISKSA